MSLVFAGITPHSPTLLPTLNSERFDELTRTTQALEIFEQELYVTKPDRIIIISKKQQQFSDAFVINAHTDFQANFSEFGDCTTHHKWIGAPDTAARIAEAAKTSDTPVRLISESTVGYDIGVPLSYITQQIPNTAILPVGPSDAPAKAHVDFGALIHETVMTQRERIALVVAGDLSHSGDTEDTTPHTYDQQLLDLLETRNTMGLTRIDDELIHAANGTLHQPLLIASGVLKDTQYQFKTLTHETRFGVGYLTGIFTF